MEYQWTCSLGHFCIVAEGREAVGFHQLDCKKPKIQPLDPHTRGPSPKAVALKNAYMAVLFDQDNGLSKEVWVK